MWSALGKYKSIVISIALFLLLDASVLVLNFYISLKIADDAVGVNLAGRQRMLSQRTVKSLLEMQAAEPGSEGYIKAKQELELSYRLFNQTLLAFDEGGAAKGADGNDVYLNAVTSSRGRSALNDARELWLPYGAAINAVFTAEPATEQSLLAQAIGLASSQNLTLLGLMNTLTIDLERVATSQATRLRWVQTVGITLAIVNFLIILFHFIGELRRNDRALEIARKETTDILNTVNEGLFLLDKALRIGQQHSARLDTFFGGKQIADHTFAELIGDLVKPKDLETAERFISLLFRPDIKSNLIRDLNPLSEIEINLPDDQGGYLTRYLSFNFRRVMVNEQIESVLVTVNDVTAQVKLAQQLAEEKEKSQQQLEMLTSILHTNPTTLKRFVQNSFDTFSKINKLLMDQSKSDHALKRKLNDMFIEVHNFKGEASALGLDAFADYAHHFETDIQAMQGQTQLTGNDFLKLTVQLEKLIRYTESVRGLAQKLASFSVMGKAAEKQHADTSRWDHLHTLTAACAERQQKQVELVVTGLGESDASDAQLSLVNDLCIQFIRNAVTHSVEPPAERSAQRKPTCARIDVRLARLPNGQLELSVRDDGRGLDYEKIRTKAKSLARWPDHTVDAWGQKELLNCMFEPGFSTADATTHDAGRGVGMDLIRNRIREHQGRLKIASRFGVDCIFTVLLPQALKTQAVA